MAASPGARLLGCEARGKPAFPLTRCAGLRDGGRGHPGSGERELQALGFLVISLESLPPGPTGGPSPELPSLAFHFQARLPSTCWGSKGKCVRGPTILPRPTLRKLRSRTQAKRRPPDSPEDPAAEPGTET